MSDFWFWIMTLVLGTAIGLFLGSCTDKPGDSFKVELKAQDIKPPFTNGVLYKTPPGCPDVFKFVDERGNTIYLTPQGHIYVLEKAGGV